MATALHKRALIDRLASLLGAEGLIVDADECAFYAQDVFALGPAPLAVIRPQDKETLGEAIGVAAQEGVSIVPRGGGMSYTQGYVAPAPGALIVDLGRMNRIVEINETDLTATVEAGCTWESLHRALRGRGLRAQAWGTLSGLRATIGGGMSQNGIFWGARDGTVVDGALSFEVVLADGRIMRTGQDFYRPYGPDLTGLFAADTGAFGIKVTITLQLVRDGSDFGYGSWSFADGGAFLRAMSWVARERLAAECFGFDPFLQAQRMKRDSLAKDAGQLFNMMKAQGSAWKGLKEGARVVATGRSFLEQNEFSLHAICEGRSQAAVKADLAAISKITEEAGGRAVEATIPKILRANPFPPVNSMVGPSGERWVPVHGFLPHSRLEEGWRRIGEIYERHAEEMARLEIGAGAMFACVGPSCCLLEPVFFWPDALEELHRRSLEPAHLTRLPGFPAGAESRALVERLRAEMIDMFTGLGAAHLQIARTYRLEDAHDPAAWGLLKSFKQSVDPEGLMNPGSLGL